MAEDQHIDDNKEDNTNDDSMIVLVVTDDEYKASYWDKELVSDAEGCDHGPDCCDVWCESWQEELPH
jgi:hypothetical protein